MILRLNYLNDEEKVKTIKLRSHIYEETVKKSKL